MTILLHSFVVLAKKPNTLQEIDLIQRNDTWCENFHVNDYLDGMVADPDFYEQGLICAGGEKGKDGCEGDSGSPLVVKEISKNRVVQVGLMSGSVVSQCGMENVPSYYTRVSYYLKWILDNIKE